jgi:hypothetical protein
MRTLRSPPTQGLVRVGSKYLLGEAAVRLREGGGGGGGGRWTLKMNRQERSARQARNKNKKPDAPHKQAYEAHNKGHHVEPEKNAGSGCILIIDGQNSPWTKIEPTESRLRLGPVNWRTSGLHVAAELRGLHLIHSGDIEFGRAHCILVTDGRHTVVVISESEGLRKGGSANYCADEECYKARFILLARQHSSQASTKFIEHQEL